MRILKYAQSSFFFVKKNSLQLLNLHNSKLVYFLFFQLVISSLILFAGELNAQTKEDCLVCHSDEGLTMEKNGQEISLFVNENILNNSAHSKLECVTCHKGFNPEELPHKENITPINCIDCHKDAGVKHPFHPQLLKAKGTETSQDLNCKNCHGAHNVIPKDSKNFPFALSKQTESCGKCHSNIKEDFLHSDHFNAIQNNIKGAPNCITCHKTPITNKTVKRDTLQTKIAQEKLCLSCHLDNPEVRQRISPSSAFIKAYENSVHGKALLGGNKKAANCVDCHNSHKIISGKNSESSVFKLNIPQTCSKCHSEIAKTYSESIHGQAIAKGNLDAPVCTDCHGEHNILSPQNPKSQVSFQHVSKEVCAPCHSSVKLSEKYGIAANRFSTFKDSYHGLALEGGSAEVANCASCHGFHDIKPSSDPTSSVNKANLSKTCGRCHPGANENFAVGSVHITLEKEQEPILYWISTIYIILIIVVIGGMFIHNLFDLIKKAKVKLLIRRGVLKHPYYGHSLYLRMTRTERIQHFALLISFTFLVITGFMLRFPDAWWVRYIRDLIPNAFELRSLIHRISAVVMVSASLFHLYYIIFTERGRNLVRDLLPRVQDVKDAIGVFKYNFGISNEKPKFGRFSYIEKSEYWALVWGTAVMSITGIIMWFDNTFIGLFTKLGWDIARTIHYFEAWLAFLAIVVWHIYFVIFNPDVYPMNIAWWKGTLTEEEMAEEHPLELEELKKREEEEKLKSNNNQEK